MDTDGEGREAKTESSSTTDPKAGTGAPTTGRASRRGIVLGGLAGLLILAGVYYFVGHRAGTEVATETRSERPADNPTIAQTPRAPDSLSKSASSTPPSQEQTAQPQLPPRSEPQQSASASPPPVITAPAETPATPASPPATLATPAAPPPAAIVPDAAKAAPTAPPAAASEAASTAQPSMRDQPAALPDQAAAAPKKENVLVVMRGPANIRSAPGKKGRVIGTAPRDATVKELDRSGNWVQVETDTGTGWINAALLGSPESR
jgi:hypothetical protein